MDLSGRVAMVTGASRGIGMATARILASRGAQLLLLDLREQEGAALAHELGSGAEFCVLDVTSEEQWQVAVMHASARFGGVDILVNSAGIYTTAPIEETSTDLFEQMYRVNQLGPFLGMRAVIPAMRERGGGSIINLSSTSGLRGNQFSIAYGSSKWAVRGMTKVAAVELGEYGIRVNSVHPGLIDTPMNHEEMGAERIALGGARTPLRRPGQAEDVAEMIAFLASDASAYCSGGEFVVDGADSAGVQRKRFSNR